MTACANCTDDAKYVHKVTPNPKTDTYFCPRHLPRFLYPQMKAGILNIPADAVPDPVPSSTKKKKLATVEAQAVEPTAEEETAIVE